MSTIEPTDEQRAAALAFCDNHSTVRSQFGNGYLVDESTVADLLAEREAALHEQVSKLTAAVQALREDLRRATIRLTRCHDAKDGAG